ncbi:FAD dependent oxidoreductase [Aspergillus venezuelensis]
MTSKFPANTPESEKRGPPVENPCISFWQQTTRAFPHLQVHKDTPLPSTSPYVVIGSGISGGLLTYELIEAGIPGEDIIILEAREAASGASSRNAGHVRPDAFRGFETYTKHHGKEQALKILANERLVLEKVDQFVREHNVPCDFHYTTTFDCCMTPEFAEHEKRNFEAFRAAGGDVSHVKFYKGEEAAAKTGIAGVLEAYEWPAGSIHPAKLAQWLLNSVIERGMRLYTFCPVTDVTPSRSEDSDDDSQEIQLWEIHTPRGTITTPKVIYCTNAFTGYLLPQLAPHIVPHRSQAHALIPVPDLTGTNLLKSTYSLHYALSHFYSIVQRQSDGTIVLGVLLPNPTLPSDRFFLESNFEKLALGEGLSHFWSGIVGLTSEEVPFLGPVEGKKRQFVCAGFGGHGMARIFTCAPGVAKLIAGKSWAETGLAECFAFSEERMMKLGLSQAV